MTSTPKVSVLIPTYNYAHLLDEAVQSVLDQTFSDFELVIVDNCSTDGTDAVVKKYLADSRVSFYRNKKNLGAVGNFNKCFEYATGTYVKLLCADDKLHPQLLEKFVAVMDQRPDVAIITSYNEKFGLRNYCRMPPFKGQVAGQTARESLLKFKAKNWLYAPTAVMFRKEGLKVGGFNPKLLQFSDGEFYLRLLTTGDAYVLPELLSHIRIHGGTQTAAALKKKFNAIFERYQFMKIVQADATNTEPIKKLIDAQLKKRAIRCTAIMYQMLPSFYKKESRSTFKKAFEIGYSEGVLLAPLTHYLQWEYLQRLIEQVE